MPRILIIDDEEDLLRMLGFLLEQNGHKVDTAQSGGEGLKKVFERQPDLIVLDIMMPDMDGYETCRRLKLLANIPIIILTAHSDENSLVQGFDCGADDYVTKPCDHKILTAKIKALLRRSGRIPLIRKSYSDNYLTIALNNEEVLVNGQTIKLTSTEFRLLAYLLRNANRVVPHEEIVREVWGNHKPGDRRSLKLYMLYLRRKIEKNPDRPVYLKTSWGVGYRFHSQSQASGF